MTPADIASGILLLGPGFVFWKTVYLSGAQHRRAEWEWVVWSVLTSLPIAGFTLGVRHLLAPSISVGEPLATYLESASRFAVALVAGAIAGWIWRNIKRSNRPRAKAIQRSIRDSAWDLAMDEASEEREGGTRLYGLQVTIEVGGTTESYYGCLNAFGYEAADVERWIYLTQVHVWDKGEKRYRVKPGTHAMLFHADRTQKIRIIDWPEKKPKDAPATSKASGA